MQKNTFAAVGLSTCALAFTLLLTASLPAQSPRPGGAAGGRATGVGTGIARSTTTTSTNRGASVAGARQYRSSTELGDAIIEVDPETRSLIIVTDEDTHRELTQVIKTLDQPKPQVLIKVVFLEVTYNKGYDVGVDGNYTFRLENPTNALTGNSTTNSVTTNTSNNGTTTGTTTTNVVRDLGQVAQVAETLGAQTLFGAPLTGSFARVVSDDWTATLHALSSRGKVEVLSRPSIMARNNQEAVIVVGSEVPFVTNSRTDALGNLNNTITYDNVGIILRVTPFITSQGSVEMIVAPEISALTDQTVPISSTASAPVISKRSAETVVVTPNRQTVVIGGLMQTQKISSVQKIPLLGDIPYLGLPFRRTITSDVKSELLIFLTPYIVSDARSLYASTAEEVGRTELVEKAFKQKDFEKYLDAPPLPSDGEIDDRPALPRWVPPADPTPLLKARPAATPAPAPAAPAPKAKPAAGASRPQTNPKAPGR